MQNDFKNNWKLLVSSALLSVCVASFAAPSLVSGIAFFVNGYPVTLVELYKMQQQEKIPQDVAVDRLINERLHEEEIKKRKLTASDLEIEDEIQRVAKQNKTTLEKVRKYVEGNGGSWNAYKASIKKEILKRKLYQSITQESIRMVDDKEVREYYNANQSDFLIPQSIDVVKFYSKDSAAIERLIQSNGKSVSPSVKQENEVLQIAALNPQVVPSFTQGKVGGFTPIFPIGEEYVTFLIKSKHNPVLLPYENAKNIALQKIMQRKENYVIYEYFEKLRSNAKVDIVRLN
ncbi:SurA N-terminal domain-containing protein [Helicobacter turcicus]|uniref:SurA N-terminal domain-containing protein n=1 Tax=Helicobacter turcicus TaxID=2867412 RepID=A0ABS7JMU8_9HELI|nr:peptidyl-prolyl cis-trans isomerase [Helicobacter turcicus]MBX7490721.1 SurA N-terminal domain-containing protein [Helicobacter turcicus]MBX7545670.1 SurA N-terminal domain-containing protein [Helicobacter turcicus]